MKINQNNFLRDLPASWMYDRLKDVVYLRNDRTNDSSEIENYLELEDLESGTGRILNRRNTMPACRFFADRKMRSFTV